MDSPHPYEPVLAEKTANSTDLAIQDARGISTATSTGRATATWPSRQTQLARMAWTRLLAWLCKKKQIFPWRATRCLDMLTGASK
jgi:hypothetical protein